MTTQAEGVVKLDGRSRIAIGRYTELEPDGLFRVTRTPNGELLLTPVRTPAPSNLVDKS